MSDTRLTFLLPERRRFGGQALSADVAKVIGRADKLPAHNEGVQAQLERHVSILPRRWPLAALTRQWDVKDAEHYSWLRADPAYVRAEMGVVRLMACGDFGLTQREADELTKPLKILFGDLGFLLSAPSSERWYLMLPKESKLPEFSLPEAAIGGDIFSQLPSDDVAKRWRALLNEAQITLHNHPLNAERIQKGLLPVNSLYFWGGGILPDQVKFHASQIKSDDIIIKSLMQYAGMGDEIKSSGATLADCRRLRDWAMFERDYLLPALAELKNKKHASIVLDFADGASFEIKLSHAWRFWRSPLNALV